MAEMSLRVIPLHRPNSTFYQNSITGMPLIIQF
jgi:hypothetical protein